MTEVVFISGGRTPFGTYGGALKEIPVVELTAIAARAALARASIEPSQVSQAVFGNVLLTTGDSIYFTRHVALAAGCPIETPALTVNRLCGSGFQAIVSGAEQIVLGETEAVLVAGTENMSQAPFVLRGAREGWGLGKAPPVEDSLFGALTDSYGNVPMAITAENL